MTGQRDSDGPAKAHVISSGYDPLATPASTSPFPPCLRRPACSSTCTACLRGGRYPQSAFAHLLPDVSRGRSTGKGRHLLKKYRLVIVSWLPDEGKTMIAMEQAAQTMRA